MILDPGEALHLPVRHPPKEPNLRLMLIHGAWELVKLHAPKKIDGLKLDKSAVDWIDDKYQVIFYPDGII